MNRVPSDNFDLQLTTFSDPSPLTPSLKGRGGNSAPLNYALSLAYAGLGQVWPNPGVGAVVVRDGNYVGAGSTGRGGRPHAETIALAQAGEKAKGATLYVTLEPCNHMGATPPCTEAIIQAGIAEVVIACRDKNPKVSGSGIARLKAAGITVTEGVCEAEAAALNTGFFKQITTGMPLVALKLATTLDGRIATQTGESKWITGEAARTRAHLLRAQYDAVLTSVRSVIADDPMLTCRLPGLENRTPVRVVLDAELKIPLTSQLVKTAKQHPLWVLTAQADGEKATALKECGVKVLHAPREGEHMHLQAALLLLGERGITRLLVEAGGALSGAFLASGQVDKIYWFRAPFAMGSEAISAVNTPFSPILASLPRYKRKSFITLGEDGLEELVVSD